jgi:hypothetical protein
MSEARPIADSKQIIDIAHQVEHGDATALSQFFSGMSRTEQLGYALQLQQIVAKDIIRDPEIAKTIQPLIVNSFQSAEYNVAVLEIKSPASGPVPLVPSIALYHSQFDVQGNLTSESHAINQPDQQNSTPLSHDQIVELTHQVEHYIGAGVEAAFRGRSFEDQIMYAQQITAVNREDISRNKKIPQIAEKDDLSRNLPSSLEILVGSGTVAKVYAAEFDAGLKQISEAHLQRPLF